MAKYNKLVRDKIPEYIKDRGGVPVYHVATEKEYWEKLKEKLAEELQEFQADESIEELADLLEVIDAIKLYKNFTTSELDKIREKKNEERGRFNAKIILDEA